MCRARKSLSSTQPRSEPASPRTQQRSGHLPKRGNVATSKRAISYSSSKTSGTCLTGVCVLPQTQSEKGDRRYTPHTCGAGLSCTVRIPTTKPKCLFPVCRDAHPVFRMRAAAAGMSRLSAGGCPGSPWTASPFRQPGDRFVTNPARSFAPRPYDRFAFFEDEATGLSDRGLSGHSTRVFTPAA